MMPSVNHGELNIEDSILKVLAYFDLFDYPITREEIKTFLEQPALETEIINVLAQLLKDQRIYRHDEFYSLKSEYSLAERRRKGNKRAMDLLSKATKISKLLYSFPYVRAIGISGSISKNFADEQADIDYFVITKANRLWIARTFMHLFKKLPFLKGRQHLYCMNYYVDEAVLQIEEKNIYTATELITLMPMYGNGSLKNFFDANEWAMDYFPNYTTRDFKTRGRVAEPWFKKVIEFLFNNKIGDWLDDYFLKLTTRRWKLKEEQHRLNTKGESMGLKTNKHCSKPNPVFFHDRIIETYKKNLEKLGLKGLKDG